MGMKFSCSQGFLVFAYTWKCGRRSRCTHTMRARTCVSVVVFVACKLRPCPSYCGRRDRNTSVHWRSLYRGGAVLLVHCCVLQISCSQGTTQYPISCRSLSFSQFQPWMLVILTCTHLVLLSIFNLQEAVKKLVKRHCKAVRLADVFANRTLHFKHDVPEPNCLP